MIIDKKAIISELASKYGIILTDKDPVFSVFATHEIMLNEHQNIILQTLDGLQVNLDEMAHRQRKIIKSQGETFIIQTLNALKLEHSGIQKRFEDMLVKERQSYLAALDGKIQTLQHWMWINLGAALLSVASLLVTVLALAG
jgi:Transcriptional activator TraM.